MSFQPQCEFEVYQYGKSSSNMTHIWGNCFTKAEANDIKKAWERSDMDLQIAEKGYKPKFYIGKDSDYMTLYYAAEFSGMKYDRDEYDRLFRDK